MNNPSFRMPNRGAAVSTALSRDKSARKNFLLKISCNPLISIDSDERIKGNPRKPTPQNRGFSQRNGDEPRKPKPDQLNDVAPAAEKEPNGLHPNALRSSRPPNPARSCRSRPGA